MDRNGSAIFTNVWQQNISSTPGSIDISYQILDTRGNVISGERRVGNGIISDVNVTSRHQAGMDVNVFLANNLRREASADGFFRW